MQRIVCVISILFFSTLSFLALSEDFKPSLQLNKLSFEPGEVIFVQFTAPGHFVTDAWIGIVPSTVMHGLESINDEFDIRSRYLNQSTYGTFYLVAPEEEGAYDVRMFDADDNGLEVAFITFSVETKQAKDKMRLDDLNENHVSVQEEVE